MSDVAIPDLAMVESEIRAAIDARTHGSLKLLGHGEISIVLGWPGDSPQHALKRVPPFASAALAQQYVAVCERYLKIIGDADVPIWPTTFHTLQRAHGSTVVYHRQPIADAAQVGVNVLRSATPAANHPLLEAIVRHAAAVVRPGRIGFDVQAANWVWDGTTARQLDFTSPFLLDHTGRDLEFDTAGFLHEYPAAVRPVLKRELLKLIQRFTTAEGAIGDMVGNLQKEELYDWVDPAIEAARVHVGVQIDRAATTKMFEDDKKLMPLALKLKRGQRWWLSHTGRTYDSMLPLRTTYDR